MADEELKTTATETPKQQQQQQQRRSRTSSEMITANIFGVSTTPRMESIVGDVVGEYACVWEKLNGSLFAGSKGIYFLGSSFLFQRKLVLVWEQIRLVQKVDQGVEVVCKKDGTVHSFAGILAPERVWALLLTLHNDALLDRRGKRNKVTPRNSTLRRRNSDPWITSGVVAEGLGGADQPVDSGERPKSSVTILEEERVQNGALLTPRTQNINGISNKSSLTMSTTEEANLRSFSNSEVESIAGPLRLPPIPCTYDNTRGRLHVGEDSIYFLGRKFFWEKKTVTVRWEMLSRIQVVSAESSSLGVDETISSSPPTTTDGLRFVQNNDESFDFKGIADAHSIWASLLSLHNEKLTRTSTSGNRHRLHRRNNSDPNLQASRLKSDDNTDPSVLDTSIDSLGYEPSSSRIIDDVVAPKQQEDWSTVQQVGKCNVVVVEAHTLKCSLDQFFDLFLSDEAEYSLQKFLELKGDKDLKGSPWKTLLEESGNNNSAPQSRVLSYTHPVNAPLAPPEAAARKEQTYRRYGEHGLIVETKTFVDDVPMADCFFVYDRMIVQPQEGEEEEEALSISMEFSVTFVKSTMFKSIISKTTVTEFTEFSEAYANHMATCLGEAPLSVENKVLEEVVTKPLERSRAPSFEKTVFSLLVVIFLFQIWIMFELHGLKASCQALSELLKVGQDSSEITKAANPTSDTSLSKSSSAAPFRNDVDESSIILVCKDYTLKCSIDEFYDLFLGDEAEHSLSSFLESRGNRELSVTSWKAADGDADSMSRTLEYIHPVNIPLAPAEASARKEQTFWRQSSTEMVVETLTFVEDVPLADCFFVSDWMTVRARGSKEVSIEMEFSLTFTKSTMLKGIISKTGGTEFIGFSKAYTSFLSKSLGDSIQESSPSVAAKD